MRQRPSLKEYLMTVASAVATRSTCRRQVGCVLADEKGRILATGYNGPPAGVSNCIDRGCARDFCTNGCEYCPTGHCDSVHAEQNAVLQCHEPDVVHYAVVTRGPCLSCLTLLMNTGVKEILYRDTSSHTEAELYWHRHRGHYWTQVRPTPAIVPAV